MNAQIIAHERMSVYAYLGVSDAILKLAIAYLITVSSFDKLITLGTLNVCISVGMYIFYHIYCKKHFPEYNFGKQMDKKLSREMLGFSIWSLLGHLQVMLKNQGINILINLFFGPAVNAANAIAYQVNNAIVQFSNNFTTALNPQIIKSYAANEREQMKALIFRAGKFSFFLLMILSIPALLETEIILHLWLKNVPEYTTILTRLIIVFTLIESYAFSVYTPISAKGEIQNYWLILSGIFLLNLPLSYIFYKIGAAPSMALITSNVLCIVVIPVRLFFLKKYISIGILEYAKNVFLISVIVCAASTIIPLGIHLYMPYSIFRFFIVGITSILCSVISIYLIGLKKNEKQIIIMILKNKLLKKRKL
jgi:O-antigen/teichoic acid export membrane protein